MMLFGSGGLAAGAVGRLLLARLRRGVVLRPGPCEAAGAVLMGAVGALWHAGAVPGWWLPVPLAVTALAVPLTVVDLRHRRLPDALTLPAYAVFGAVLAAVAWLRSDTAVLTAASAGAAAFLVAHAAVAVAAPGSLGWGDVKLSGSLGGVLGAVGWTALLAAALFAAVVTLVLAVVGRVARIREWRGGVPHGPGMLAATWLVAVVGRGTEVGLMT